MKAVVFLNRQKDGEGRLAIFTRMGDESPYQDDDEIEQVFEADVEGADKMQALEKVYAMLNRGSGTFVGDDAYPQRSLSVGDVVSLDGERFMVAMSGYIALACEQCGGDPCYKLCPANPSYYSAEQEREDSLWQESLSDGEYMSLAMAQYEQEHGEPYVS